MMSLKSYCPALILVNVFKVLSGPLRAENLSVPQLLWDRHSFSLSQNFLTSFFNQNASKRHLGKYTLPLHCLRKRVENETGCILTSLTKTRTGTERCQKCVCERACGRGGGGDRMKSFAKQSSRCQC